MSLRFDADMAADGYCGRTGKDTTCLVGKSLPIEPTPAPAPTIIPVINLIGGYLNACMQFSPSPLLLVILVLLVPLLL